MRSKDQGLGARAAPKFPWGFPVSCSLFRVDTEHAVTGGQQCPHPRPAVRLDAHQHVGEFGIGVSEPSVEFTEPTDLCCSFGQGSGLAGVPVRGPRLASKFRLARLTCR